MSNAQPNLSPAQQQSARKAGLSSASTIQATAAVDAHSAGSSHQQPSAGASGSRGAGSAGSADNGRVEGSARGGPGSAATPQVHLVKGGFSKFAVVVSTRQRGNPILQGIKAVPWEYGDIVPDYLLGPTTCALFLSLKYHNLNPEYIYDRLRDLGKAFTLRILLVLVDIKDPHHPLKELAKMAILADVTLLPAWSSEEAGRYLEMYKSFENKPADLIKSHVEGDYFSKFTEALTSVRSVNKTDARNLSANYKSFDRITKTDQDDLALLPGFGAQKAKRLYDVLHQPFLRANRTTNTGTQPTSS